MHRVGTDIVNINRIRSLISRYNNKFLCKIFSKVEVDYCNKFSDPPIHFAGKFSAKEAIIKAISKKYSKTLLSYKDIVISNDKDGRPFVVSDKINSKLIDISISHTKEFAISFAIFSDIQ